MEAGVSFIYILKVCRPNQYNTVSFSRALTLKNIMLPSVMTVNGCTSCLLCQGQGLSQAGLHNSEAEDEPGE